MEKEEFIREVKNHIDNSYVIFENYQKITWEIMSYVNKLFRENGLTYYLAYGTLLGAIRDQGIIPWDYDVDIHIKVSDKNHLLEILKTKLSDEYYYVYTDNMSNYPAECLRICKKGYTYMAFHVDVFFLVGCPDNKIKRIPLLKKARKWSNFRIHKYAFMHDGEVSSANKIKAFLLKVYNLKYKLVPEKYIMLKEKEIFYSYKIQDSKYYMSYSFEANWGDKEYEVYPSHIFNDVIDVNIDGEFYSIPSGYDEYLSLLYKDYMNYLSIESRFNEFYFQLHRIKKRQEYYLRKLVKA